MANILITPTLTGAVNAKVMRKLQFRNIDGEKGTGRDTATAQGGVIEQRNGEATANPAPGNLTTGDIGGYLKLKGKIEQEGNVTKIKRPKERNPTAVRSLHRFPVCCFIAQP